MSARLSVDRDRCEANGTCVRIAPEVFELDDEDELHLHQEEVPAELREAVERAVLRCPKQALTLES